MKKTTLSKLALVAALGAFAAGCANQQQTNTAVGAGGGARRERLALPFDVDEALPTGTGGFEQRVVTEPRDLDSELLGGANDQGSLRNGHFDAVDGERDCVTHQCAPTRSEAFNNGWRRPSM